MWIDVVTYILNVICVFGYLLDIYYLIQNKLE